MSTRRGAIGNIGQLAAACALGGALASSAGASPRAETLAQLEAIPACAQGSGLRAWVNDGSEHELELGEPVVLRFRSEAEGYLSVLHLDSHGVVTLVFPNGEREAARLEPLREKAFPPPEADYALEARLPLGEETVYALATREPLALEALGLEARPGELAWVEADQAPALAQRLASRVAALPGGCAAKARIDQRVISSRGEGLPQYTARGIVHYFTESRRAIRRPKLDLNIQFAFNSADLTPSARRDLDEVGKALADPQLTGERFLLAGHTDDLGSESYNETLSQERAAAARQYLVGAFAIEPDRLATAGYGESQPLATGSSEEARAQNRRVVLELVR